ncbi:DUF5666 domain-containing protein [Piscinibacter sakaiensis]|uniref:DUF5666 domain-containing protein n=1 Tax=Piscinibacter sakaiensis TaxID=1547922 RepID=UPI0006B61EE2|nr:DUF5666 domain-containing protein [Piscinibacter sakaiensis]
MSAPRGACDTTEAPGANRAPEGAGEPDAARRRLLSAGLAWAAGPALLAALPGCGGGAGVGGTGDTAGSFSSGAISGFGSVIVNGVRYDERGARIEDDAGRPRAAADLRLGMVTEIDAGPVQRDAAGQLLAVAERVRIASELSGPVAALLPPDAFVVLGQTVRISVATVVDERMAGGLLAGLAVEVHGYSDGSALVATRIEPASQPGEPKLRGIVAGLDRAAQTFRIGGQAFRYAGASGIPADLADGRYVRLALAPAPLDGRWPVTAFRSAQASLPAGAEAKLEGRITRFDGLAGLAVNGQPVDASGVPLPGLALGVRVEVEGPVSGGVLRATRLRIETEDSVRSEGVDLRGPITALDRGLRRFVLRGSSVDYSGAGIRYDDGSEADLAVGRTVEVRGSLSADGTRVLASRIRIG